MADKPGKRAIITSLEASFRERFAMSEDCAPIETFWKISPSRPSKPAIPLVFESELGQRFKQAKYSIKHKEMMFVVSRRFKINLWEKLWDDLEVHHGLDNQDRIQNEQRITTPQLQLDFLITYMNWPPMKAWNYLKRFGRFIEYSKNISQLKQINSEQQELSKQLWINYLAEKEKLYKANQEKKTLISKLSILQFSFILNSQCIWSRTQWRRAEFMEQTISSPVHFCYNYSIDLPTVWSYSLGENQLSNFYYYDKKAISDYGTLLKIYNTDEEVLEVSLRFAVLKFGNHLHLEGSENFKKRILQTAKKLKMRISFDEQDLNKEQESMSIDDKNKGEIEYP